MDRRKRKSRQAMLEACVTLCKEKDFQQITINDIVEQADLNRGTFYLHFTDKADMLKSFEQEMLNKIEQVLISNIPDTTSFDEFMQSRYDTIVQIIHCYEENKQLLYVILNASNTAAFQAQFGDKIKTILNDLIFPKVNVAQITVPIDVIAMIFTSISLSFAQYAYDSNEPIDVEAHAEFLMSIMLYGPLKTFGFLPK